MNLVHDVGVFTHGNKAAKQARLAEVTAGGHRATDGLCDEGAIAHFGAGANEREPCDWLLDRGAFDVLLSAGRLPFLEQGALAFMNTDRIDNNGRAAVAQIPVAFWWELAAEGLLPSPSAAPQPKSQV